MLRHCILPSCLPWPVGVKWWWGSKEDRLLMTSLRLISYYSNVKWCIKAGHLQPINNQNTVLTVRWSNDSFHISSSVFFIILVSEWVWWSRGKERDSYRSLPSAAGKRLKPGNELALVSSFVSTSAGILSLLVPEMRSVVNTSLRDFRVLFYSIKYVIKYPTCDFWRFYLS